LSVFEGGFSLEAAEEVLASEPDAPWALDVLTELSESSLLAPDGDRFRMLAGIQEYAAEKLTAEERADAERRHGEHFGRLASAGRGTAPPADLENLVAASQRAASRRDAGVAAATAVAACERLEEVGPYALALALLSGAAALDLAPTDASAVLRSRARLLGYLGRGPEALDAATAALASAGDDAEARLEAAVEVAERLRTAGRAEEARVTGEQALASAREQADPEVLASALLTVGSSWMQAGRYDDARRAFEEGLALFRACGDGLGEGAALSSQAALATEQGRHQQARDLAATAVTLHRRNGSRRREATSLGNVGLAEAHLGRNEAAREALGRAQVIHADLGDRRGEAIVLSHLARVHIADGRTDDARRSLTTSIAYSREAHDAPRLCPTLIQLAVLEHIDGRFPEARAVYGEALAVAEGAGLARFEAQAAMNSGVLLVENGELAPGAALLRRAERAYERLGLNAGRALTLANLGAALVECGLPDEGRRALQDAVTAGRACSSAWASGNALLGLGEFLLNQGERELALALVREGVEVLSTLGRASASRGRALLARMHREAGELALAESTLAFSGDETTSQDTTVPAWLELARLRLAQGDAEEAVEAASHALDRAAAFLPLAAQASCVLALARHTSGDRDGALAAWEAAARLVDRAGSAGDTPLRRELARTRDALG
jgi:tetratricopeptide (TPR) repeat protein